MMPIHDCVHASLENEYFKEKLTQFYKENKRLKEELDLLRNVPTRDKLPSIEISTQTSFNRSNEAEAARGSSSCSVCCKRVNGRPALKASKENLAKKMSHTIDEPKTNFDNDVYNQQNKKSYVKLCEMQHNLLKKYEDEVNSNAVKQDLINHMKIEIDQLNSECSRHEADNEKLSRQLEQLNDLEGKLQTLLADYENCKVKCRKYKNELKCFDEKFFDELEDLKYNFYESIKLNKHYERLLFKLDKDDLIVGEGKKKKKGNRVKFDVDVVEKKKVRMCDLKLSFESMNRNYMENGDATEDSEVENEVVDNFRSFNFEDYLEDSDREDGTLDYKDLIKKLTC